MAVATIGLTGAGLTTALTALLAVAQGKDVSEESKKIWDKVKDGYKNLFDGETSNEVLKHYKEGENPETDAFGNIIGYKPKEVSAGLENYWAPKEEVAKEQPKKRENPIEEEFGKPLPNNDNDKPPTINETKVPINPGGAVLGALQGINNDNNNSIQDTTNENIETNIGSMFDNYISRMERLQKEEWARQDSAYQRAVEDARLAGMNVGALGGNIQAAQSTSNIMASAGATELNKIAEFLQQEIENNFKGDENEKNRFSQAIQMLFMYGLMTKK